MISWIKEKGIGVWDFQEKDISQRQQKEQMFGKQIFAGPYRNNRTQNFIFFIKCFLNKILFIFILFWSCCMACGILVPWPGIEPVASAVEAEVLTPWLPGNSPENFNKQIFLGSSLSTKPSSHCTVLIYGDNSLPGTHPLSPVCRKLEREGGKSSSWSICFFKKQPVYSNPHAKETYFGVINFAPRWHSGKRIQPGGLQSMGLQRVRHDWGCMHLPLSYWL